jgi:hypothetical protein
VFFPSAMSRTLSPWLSDEEHQVRRLLGQRQAGDVLQRISTASEYSDSQSVYSRAPYSPYSDHVPNHALSALAARQDRNTLNDLAVSMLDLDDSRPSSYADPDEQDQLGELPDNAEDEDEDAGLSRMSMLGPKLSVHSRAPWEESVPEEDDSDAQSLRGKPSPTRGAFGKQLLGRPSADFQPKNSFESGSSYSSGQQKSTTL